MNPVVSLRHVSKTFGRRVAVHDVSLEIFAGQAVAILGPNGAGKTTSMQMMLGLVQPTRGTVELLGRRPGDFGVRDRIGAVLQNVSVPERLKVWECLNLVRGLYSQPCPLDELLTIGGLHDDRNVLAQTLSGGKTRRLQFALAMAGNPSVLFLDEPTVGMDVASRRHFWDAIRKLVDEGRTVLLTTHDLQEADLMTDRVILMDNGKVMADAEPERIKMEFGERRVRFVLSDMTRVEELRNFGAVQDIQTSGRLVTVATHDSDAVLKRLILDNWDVRDIRVEGTDLEDAFVHLTRGEE